MTTKKSDKPEEDFEVVISDLDSETILITSQEKSRQIIDKALSTYSGNYQTLSRDLKTDSYFTTTLTEEKLNSLAHRPQDSLSKTQEVNSYIDYYLNKDDIIGKTYEIIEANTNSSYELTYPKVDGRNKNTTLDKVKKAINSFHEQISLSSLIIETIPYVYATGNRIMYLRRNEQSKYTVDRYPLGVAEISSYKVNNENQVVFNIAELIGRLTDIDTTYATTIVFNEDIAQQLKQYYPKEVYDAYVQRKVAVKLDSNNTGLIRTNNRGRQYGLSPIFKALNPALKLEIQEKSDSVNSKARGKKIIFQEINEKLLGEDGTNIDLAPTVHAHKELLNAWKNDIVLITGAPWVKDIRYVEPKIDNTQTDNLSYYRSKTLSALGISFLNGDSKTGLASMQINLQELLQQIDKISKQLEDVMNKWYKVMLTNEGLPLEYAPTIKILDSELMETEVRMKIAEFLFSKMSASYETTFALLGIDMETERIRREKENEEGLNEIFMPRMTSYTFNGDNGDGGVDNKDVSLQPKTTKDTVKKDGA